MRANTLVQHWKATPAAWDSVTTCALKYARAGGGGLTEDSQSSPGTTWIQTLSKTLPCPLVPQSKHCP